MKQITNLLAVTSLYLEASPQLIIAISMLYAGKSANRKEMDRQYAEWQKTKKYNNDVENFCLDIMSGRINLETFLPKIKEK